MSNRIKWGKPGVRWKGPEWPQWAGPDASTGQPYIPAKYLEVMRMISRIPSMIVVLELDYCGRAFGQAPCLAAGVPCFNTWPSCKYQSAYQNVGKQYKFGLKDTPLPIRGQPIRPYLEEFQYLGQEILPDKSNLINQKLTLVMADEPDNDIGVDPYRVSPTLRQAPGGSANVSTAGTFWKKLKTRNVNYRNRKVIIKQGFIEEGFIEADYWNYFTGVLENITFDGEGKARLIIKGLLQLTDTNLPKKTDGKLMSDLSSSETSSFQLATWTGVDRSTDPPSSQYSSAGYVKIGTEIIQYSSISLDISTGLTTFSGLTRGKFNGDGWDQAIVHANGDMVQQVYVYLDLNPFDIMYDLLLQAGISDTDIDYSMFNTERVTWFDGIKFRGILDEPVKIKEYLTELREQTLTSLWQGDDQKIKVKFTGPNLPGQSYRQIKGTENIIRQSNSIDDGKDKYITRTSFYYDILPGKKGTERNEYLKATVVIDADMESANEYGTALEWKPIFSRWVRSDLGGGDYSRIIAGRILNRFKGGLRIVSFDIELKDEDMAVGEIFEFISDGIVDLDGNPSTERFQVIKKQKQDRGRISIMAQDIHLKRRYGFVAPSGTPDYTSASSAQREYAFVSNANGKMSNGDDGYLVI